MKKIKYTIFFLMILVIQPGSYAIGDLTVIEKTGLNGSALLSRNRDHIYPSNLQYLDERTPIKLDYNKYVESVIDDYILNNPAMLAKIVGRSEFYFPIFDEILAKHNLPLELKNIAVIESSLNPNAVSKSGATGLWQFLFHTSKMFNLSIDSYMDERRDPVLSTEAACEFLSYLYRIFNDWQLVITAYNCGPGRVERAIEQAGGRTNYWEIRKYLPLEARNYYPKFVAACYATSFWDVHGIQVEKFTFTADDIMTIDLKKPVWFKQISKIIGVTESDLRLLNPVFKQDYIPIYNNQIKLIIPKWAFKSFQQNEESIYSLRFEPKDYNDLKVEMGNTENRVKVIHRTSGGEYFHQIAMKYRCTIYDIMVWNNLKSKALVAGQELIVFAPINENPPFVAKLKPVNEEVAVLVEPDNSH